MSRKVAETTDTPGYEGLHWEAATWDDGDHVHVLPVGDAVDHLEDTAGDCICGPTVSPEMRDDGSNGWILTHHSLSEPEDWS